MARGKQAALAANRRAESAHEIIDRLTSEVAEAKLRARVAEADARRTAQLSSQVEDLQRRLDLACSVEVERHRAAALAALAALDEARALFSRMIERSKAQDGRLFDDTDLAVIERLGFAGAFDSVTNSPRDVRRARARRNTALREHVAIQDNRQSLFDNLGKVTLP